MDETRLITLTHDELMRFGEGCAKMAVDRAMGEMKEDFQALFTSLQLVKGIVSREDLALMFDKDPKTIRRWSARPRHKSLRRKGNLRLYYWVT